MTEQTIYKIRRKTDGKFSMGGSWPSFSKSGKLWKTKGHLHSHLNQIDTRPIRMSKHIYSDCEVVCFQMIQTEMDNPIAIDDYLAEREEVKRLKEMTQRLRYEERLRQQRKEQYDELRKEFE